MGKVRVFSYFAFAIGFLTAAPRAQATTSFFCGGTTLSDGTALPAGVSFPVNLCPTSNGMVSGVGMVFDHRDYLPATALGTIPGLMFGVEVTAVNMSNSFKDALTSIGLNGSALPLSFLPSVRAHLAKGFGPVDVSTSAFYLPGIFMLGGSVKYTFWDKDEGPSWAARLGYAYSYFPFPPQIPPGTPLFKSPINLAFITDTITPVIMMSRKLAKGVEPYIGVGGQVTFGGIDVKMDVPANLVAAAKLLGQTIPSTIEDYIPGVGLAGIAFIGLATHIPYLGLGITIEMQYSTAGATSMGFNLGFTF